MRSDSAPITSANSAQAISAIGHWMKPEMIALMREDADRIAADAEIGGVAEAHHAAVAQDQVEADRRDRQNHDAREQRHDEDVAGQLRIDRDQREEDQQRRDGDIADGERLHLLAAGNRPSGRHTRITAISR